MSTKNENPYRPNSQYHKLFSIWQKKQIITKNNLISAGMETFGLSREAATATAIVLLSPRLSSDRGDCRGNMSAQGHVYYAERFAKKNGEHRFRLRWRKEILSPLKRSEVHRIETTIETESDKAC